MMVQLVVEHSSGGTGMKQACKAGLMLRESAWGCICLDAVGASLLRAVWWVRVDSLWEVDRTA